MRVLVIKEGEMLVAQGLERDICAQAPDIETLAQRFHETVIAEQADGCFDQIPPAPHEFHAMWDAGEDLSSPFDRASPDQIEARLAA